MALYWLQVNFEYSKLWNYKEEFCALHASVNRLWNVYSVKRSAFLVEKMKTRVQCYINRPFKRQKYFFLDKRIVYQSFCIAPLTFRNFPPGKVLYLHASASRLRNVYCLLLSDKISRRKKLYLQLCLRQIAHSNGKITLSMIENCWSKFYNAPLTFSEISLRTSFVYRHASASCSQNSYCLH